MVDSSGTVKNSYYYDPYGLSLNKNETVTNPWRYAGGYHDATTGLYKFGTRYYDPQLGRWTQKDPVGGSVGKIGSGNPYVYAGNVPTMQVDPSGRDCPTAIWEGIAAVADNATITGVIYNAVVGAILSASFLPEAAATLIAGVVAYVILYIGAAETIHLIDGILPQCGINYSFGY